MKKLISYLLALVLVFSNLTAVWAEGENPVTKEDYYKKVAVGLGIVDEKLEEKEVITRSDFALVLTRLINESPKISSTSSFTDVAAGTKESAAIELLKDKGIMVGMGDGIFSPDEPVLFTHAVRLILKATDNIKDFHSKEIVSGANYEKLTKGVYATSDGRVSYDVLTRLVYNALDMTVMQTTFDKPGTVSGKTDGGETVLKKFFNLTRVVGVLETDIHSSIKELTVDGANITIDGVKYRSDKDYNESLGFKVDCFVEIDDNEVVFLTTHPENEVIKVYDKDLSYSPVSRVYTYSKDNRIKRISVENTTDIAYNDRVMTVSDDAVMVPSNGYVMFINNDKDSDIDVIRIMQYTDIYISGKSTLDEKTTIFETGGVSAVISLEDGADGSTIVSASGEVKTVKDLKAGVVASVLSDFVGSPAGGSTVSARRVIICDDSISGKLSKIDTDEGKITVGSEEYYINDRFAVPSLGSNRSYTLYLNFMGKIAAKGDLDRSDLPMAVGYVMDSYINSDGRCVAKILTYEGDVTKFVCAEKVKFEGIGTERNQNTIDNYLKTNEKLIGFTVNDDKELSRVTFPTDYSAGKPTDVPTEFGLYNIGKSSTSGGSDLKYKYFQHYKSFFGRLTLKDDTIMFVIPESGTLDSTNCKVEAISSLVNEKVYKVEGYVFDKASPYCDVIVVRDEVNPTATSTSTLCVVKKIVDTINEDDEAVKQVTVVAQSGELVLLAKDENVLTRAKKYSDDTALGRSIMVGDVMLCAVNSDEEICDIKVLYDKLRDTSYTTEYITDGKNETRKHSFMDAKVYGVDAGFIQLVDINQDVAAATFDDIEMLSFERVNIAVSDASDGKTTVRRGSVADVENYLDNGKASRVIFYSSGFIGYFMVVIK